MIASCSYDGKSKTEPRLSGSDPHGAIQIRSFGGKMKIVNLWLMPAPSTLLGDRPLAFGAPRRFESKADVSVRRDLHVRFVPIPDIDINLGRLLEHFECDLRGCSRARYVLGSDFRASTVECSPAKTPVLTIFLEHRRHLRQSRPPDIAAPAGLEYARAVVTARAKRPCRIAARAAGARCWGN
jgi:hypothetical protein